MKEGLMLFGYAGLFVYAWLLLASDQIVIDWQSLLLALWIILATICVILIVFALRGTTEEIP